MGGFHRGMWHALMRGMMWRGRGRGHHQHPPSGDGDGDGGGWDKRIKCPVCGEFKGTFTSNVCFFFIFAVSFLKMQMLSLNTITCLHRTHSGRFT